MRTDDGRRQDTLGDTFLADLIEIDDDSHPIRTKRKLTNQLEKSTLFFSILLFCFLFVYRSQIQLTITDGLYIVATKLTDNVLNILLLSIAMARQLFKLKKKNELVRQTERKTQRLLLWTAVVLFFAVLLSAEEERSRWASA